MHREPALGAVVAQMKCPQCAEVVSVGRRHCPECGTTLPRERKYVYGKQGGRKRGLGVEWKILLLVLTFAGILLVVFKLTSKSH